MDYQALTKDWEDGSVHKVLATQAWEQEFETRGRTQMPGRHEKSSAIPACEKQSSGIPTASW